MDKKDHGKLDNKGFETPEPNQQQDIREGSEEKSRPNVMVADISTLNGTPTLRYKLLTMSEDKMDMRTHGVPYEQVEEKLGVPKGVGHTTIRISYGPTSKQHPRNELSCNDAVQPFERRATAFRSKVLERNGIRDLQNLIGGMNLSSSNGDAQQATSAPSNSVESHSSEKDESEDEL